MAERHANTTLARGETPSDGGKTLRRWIIASVAVHLAVLAVVLSSRPPRLTAAAMPGDRNGHRLLLTYDPGNSVQSSSLQTPKTVLRTKAAPSTIAAPNQKPAVPTPASTLASASKDTISGADGLGDGNLTIALQIEHPYPRPDLSQLPSGTAGDVIVDVVIDDTGRIAKYTITHGLGHGIDETVLATIQQWTFHPATRNGVPVASEQELLFHYVRG